MITETKIINRVGTKTPNKKTLHQQEAMVVELERMHTSPEDAEGKYLYLRIGERLFRTILEEVELEA
jgi:hypothetical protein